MIGNIRVRQILLTDCSGGTALDTSAATTRNLNCDVAAHVSCAGGDDEELQEATILL